MALIRKTFFNITPVGNALIDEIEQKCLEHLGRAISDAEKEFNNRKKEGLPPIKISLLLDSYGKCMNINSSCIMWEDEVCFEEEEDVWLALTNYAYCFYEEGNDDSQTSENVPKLSQVHEKLKSLLWNDLIIGLKIIKLGGNEYYCYCLNRFDDKH